MLSCKYSVELRHQYGFIWSESLTFSSGRSIGYFRVPFTSVFVQNLSFGNEFTRILIVMQIKHIFIWMMVSHSRQKQKSKATRKWWTRAKSRRDVCLLMPEPLASTYGLGIDFPNFPNKIKVACMWRRNKTLPQFYFQNQINLFSL